MSSVLPKNCVYVIAAFCDRLVYRREAAHGRPLVIKVGKTYDARMRFSQLEKHMGLSEIQTVLTIADPAGGIDACEKRLKRILAAQKLLCGINKSTGFYPLNEIFAAEVDTVAGAKIFAGQFDGALVAEAYRKNDVDPLDQFDGKVSALEVSDGLSKKELQILKQYSSSGTPVASKVAREVLARFAD